MEIQIVELPEKKFVGMKFAGTFDKLHVEMPKLWTAFLARAEEVPHVKASELTFYDVGDEDFNYHMYTEYVAVEVERFETIPYGMVGFAVPPRRYVTITHVGPMSSVQDTYIKLFTQMKEHGYEQDIETMRFEQYDQRFLPTKDDPARAENAYEIFIPIK